MQVNQFEIHKLTISENVEDRLKSINLVSSNFESLHNKFSSWSDLVNLLQDPDFRVRINVVNSLTSLFYLLPTKYKSIAWTDIHNLSKHADPYVRMYVSYVIVSIFSGVLEEQKLDAWIDLSDLIMDKKSNVRRSVADAISSSFISIPEEYRFTAWKKLIVLAIDKDLGTRYCAVSCISYAFILVPEKDRIAALDDLRNLAFDKHSLVRNNATCALVSAYQYIPDNCKSLVWNDIIKLTNDNQLVIRQITSDLLHSVFPFVPSECKESAWNDLIKNIKVNSLVSDRLSNTLPVAILSISDTYLSTVKDDLSKLAKDENSHVRMNANYSLGKLYVYSASKASTEIESKDLLQRGIYYFEQASKSTQSHSAKFCHLFYRSFDAVLFSKSSSGDDIKNYIVAARNEVGNSSHKRQLLEIVEQLTNVLEIIEHADNFDIKYQELLNQCSAICNHVDQLMDKSKNTNPYIYNLYKKARPSFRNDIKELIEDIKEKAEIACQEAKGTVASEYACELYKESQRLNEDADTETNMAIVASMTFLIKNKIRKNSEYHYLLLDIDKLDSETNLNKKLCIIRDILGVVDFGSSNAIISNEIRSLRESVDQLTESVSDLQNPQEYLNTIQQNLEDIKDEIPEMKKQIDDVLYELYSPVGIDQKLKVSIPIIPLLATYEVETNPSKFVADRIFELKKLIMRLK